MYNMEVLIYNKSEVNGDPIETGMDGETIEILKNDLNGIIIDAVELFDKESGSYFVEVTFTQNGEYVDSDEFDCFVNLKDRIIMY